MMWPHEPAADARRDGTGRGTSTPMKNNLTAILTKLQPDVCLPGSFHTVLNSN